MKIPFTDYHVLGFLKAFRGSTAPLDLGLQKYFAAHKSLGSKDRKTIGDIVYGMTRWHTLLEHCTDELSAQLALYHRFAKEGFDSAEGIPRHAQLGSTRFLYQLFIRHFGLEPAEQLLKILNEEAPVTVRVNALKTTREALLAAWQPLYRVEPCQHSPWGIRFFKREPLFSLPAFKEGLFEIQDEGSQQIAALMKVKPGQHVLDFCSGSGGKTLAFAPLMEGKGQIFLHDVRPSALAQAKKRLARAGIQNGQCLGPDHPQLLRLKKKCHWVLVDVPCTGTGTLRRNPDQKGRLNAAMIERLVAEQKEIFGKAFSYLHPKGEIVYATCSVLPEENSEQVAYFLKHFPLELVNTLSFLPTSGGPDGFFGAVFRKKAT